MLQECIVLENRPLSSEYFLLTLSTEAFPQAVMGQFVELRTSNQKAMLRRPFTVFRQGDTWLSILYKVLGTGTWLLSQAVPGSRISMLGPLGNGFSSDPAASSVLVGRGVGLATFGSARSFFPKETAIHLIASFRSPDIAAPLLPLFERDFFVHPVYDSDNTSAPEQVRTLAESFSPDSCYLCGSRRLLKALQTMECPVFVSLEERMACGIGSCQGCVVDTVNGYRRVCRDGPCFSAKEVKL